MSETRASFHASEDLVIVGYRIRIAPSGEDISLHGRWNEPHWPMSHNLSTVLVISVAKGFIHNNPYLNLTANVSDSFLRSNTSLGCLCSNGGLKWMRGVDRWCLGKVEI